MLAGNPGFMNNKAPAPPFGFNQQTSQGSLNNTVTNNTPQNNSQFGGNANANSGTVLPSQGFNLSNNAMPIQPHTGSNEIQQNTGMISGNKINNYPPPPAVKNPKASENSVADA